MYSVKFKGCRTIYPLRIIRPLKKVNDIDHVEQLNLTLSDIYDNGFTISQILGDNPKRSNIKKCLGHSSWFPCEYCFSKGTKIVTNNVELTKKKKSLETQRKILAEKMKEATGADLANLKKFDKELIESEKKLKPKQSNIVWPKTTANGPPRTRREILEIIEKIENDQPLTPDEAKGITGRSLLFDLPGFDFVADVPVDYLHCGCLGVIKRSVELTFKVGETRPRITKRPLSSPHLFNTLIARVKVMRECNRRVRDLDFSVYKGQEFRNLALFFFPIILTCIEEGSKERDLWLHLSYMIKSCVIPSEEFENIDLNVVNNSMTKFYSLYQQLFGVQNCTYNTHVLGSHLLEMRFHGPLTLTSTFPFESFYGEMRNSFVPGTTSPLKQIFTNVLMKRAISHHCCKKEIHISAKDTPMECNSYVYCYENRKYSLYKVTQVNDNTLTCQKQETLPCTFPETGNLNWSAVGVFKKGNIAENEIIVAKTDVKGKVIIVQDFLITCPNNILREK